MARTFLEVNPATQLFDPVEGISVSSGTPDAGKLVMTRGDGTIDPSMLPSNTSVGGVAQAGMTLPEGMFVSAYMDGPTKKVKLASAQGFETAACGFVRKRVFIGDTLVYYPYGEHLFIPAEGKFTNEDINKPVWLSDTTPGGVSLQCPTAEGHIAQKIGVVDSFVVQAGIKTVRIFVNIQPYIILSEPDYPSHLMLLPDGNFKAVTHRPQAYNHTQAIKDALWSITHNLGFRPSVSVVDEFGVVVYGDVEHPSLNQTLIKFGIPTVGTARLS